MLPAGARVAQELPHAPRGLRDEVEVPQLRTGALSEIAYAEFLGKMYSLPTVALSETQISAEVATLIPEEVATRFGVVPIERKGRVLKVAMSNPSNIFAIDDIKFITKFNICRFNLVSTCKCWIECHYFIFS